MVLAVLMIALARWEKVRKAELKMCCSGIVGMNETRKERAGLIASLANADPQPESVPLINSLRLKVHH